MAGKSNGSHNMETDWARAPPPPGSAWERFCKAIYNPEENSCLGRTPQRWGEFSFIYLYVGAVVILCYSQFLVPTEQGIVIWGYCLLHIYI